MFTEYKNKLCKTHTLMGLWMVSAFNTSQEPVIIIIKVVHLSVVLVECY